MPKSKRDKKISLTKTDKKGLQLKQKIFEDIRSCIEKYNSIYVFSYYNLRNEKMKQIRQEWKPSRFLFGKNKVIAIAMGRTEEEEVSKDLHKLAATLSGQCAILFTDSKKQEVLDWFEEFTYEDYARSGFKVKETIELKQGPMPQFSHAIEPYLRQIGMPTKLEKGVVTLIKDYVVCKAGSVLNPEQAKILQLLEMKMCEFKLVLKSCWIKDEGFEMLKVDEDEEEEEMEEAKDVEMSGEEET